MSEVKTVRIAGQEIWLGSWRSDPDPEEWFIDTAQLAKIIRAVLKRIYPGTKFYIRSKNFSMGSSIDIAYMDGPAEKEVARIADSYETAQFDGMIDYSYSSDLWLMPDGSAITAHNPGSQCTGGMHREIRNEKPSPDALRISPCHCYIHVKRGMSREFGEQVVDLVESMGFEKVKLYYSKFWLSGGKTIESVDFSWNFGSDQEYEYARNLAYKLARIMTFDNGEVNYKGLTGENLISRMRLEVNSIGSL